MVVYYWLVVALICFFLEINTRALVAIWYTGGALIAALVAKMGLPLGYQIGAFIVVSLILFLPTRKLASRWINKNVEKTNVESLVGEICIVSKEINNLLDCGQAILNGMEWTARSFREDEVIPEGTKVEIKEISGVKLIVKPVE